MLEHEKFRAGYDFLCIRAQAVEDTAGESLQQDCKWWTEIQKQTAEQQKNTLFSTPKKKSGNSGKSRRSSTRKKKLKKQSSRPE